jgi:SAM-dependent methyltransferase
MTPVEEHLKNIDQLAEHLVERYDLHGKQLVEIGSGKGEFLTLLCELGGNHATGFDPNYGGSGADGPVRFVQDYYSERYTSTPADFICSRQTLEHLPQPREFLSMLRRSLGERVDTVVFFEVPNALFTLRELSVWDLIYEHVSYFTAESLAYLFRQAGFDVLDVRETFGGQYLAIEARPCAAGTQPAPEPPDLTRLSQDVSSFVENYIRKTAEWQDLLATVRAGEKRAVVWSAGSKGVTFLNLMQVGAEIPYVVDINPRKQGMFVAGAGQEIVPPERLREFRPDWIILMNPIYREEIGGMARSLGLDLVEFLQA